MLLLYSIAAGLIIGRLVGGRTRNLEAVRFAWWPLALAGFIVQLLLFADPIQVRVGAEGPLIYVASTVAVLLALLRNVRLPGFLILASGAILNLVAVVANGGFMPSSAEAWLELTGSAAIPVAHYSNVTLIGPDTLFPFLGDIFVFPRPLPLATAFSIGDALIALGAIIFLVTAMRSPARAASGAPVPAPTSAPSAQPAPR